MRNKSSVVCLLEQPSEQTFERKMLNLSLPKNMLRKEQYLALPSLQKEEYIHNILKGILLLNQNGVTVSDIENNTFFGRSTVWHHMEHLNTTGECLKMERGDTDVYHLNKVIASFKELGLKGGDIEALYHFDIVENTYDKYLRIQRKRESRTKAHVTRQGIIIELTLLDNMITAMNKIKEFTSK